MDNFLAHGVLGFTITARLSTADIRRVQIPQDPILRNIALTVVFITHTISLKRALAWVWLDTPGEAKTLN